MHTSAREFGRHFLACYWGETSRRILDVGSRDLNGSLRPFCPAGAQFVGVDLEDGEGVDVVLTDPYAYPFDDRHFDLVVSTSCLEHDPMFWLTFLECLRVVKPDGFVYFNCPSNGPYHAFPSDHWRFYPDAGQALQGWGRRVGQPNWLVELFIGPLMPDDETWKDCVMIFSRVQPICQNLRFLSDIVAGCTDIYRIDRPRT